MTEVSAGTLTDFLLRRIADEAEAATRALDQPLGYRWRTLSWLTEANRDHGLLWDPARVLAECEAKRQVVAEVSRWRHHVSEDCWYTCPAATEDVDGGVCCDDDRRGGSCDCGHDHSVAVVLGALALPYAGHAEFNPAWRL